MATRPKLRWWPGYRPDSVEIGGGGPRLLLAMGAGIAALAALLSLPFVREATGLSAAQAWAILGGYYAAMVCNDLVLHPMARRARWGFDLQIALLFAYNHLFPTLLVVVPNRPWSPLWMALALWSFQTASWQEIEGSVFALACHALAPLLTIPVFIARGAPVAQSVAAPVLTSAVCALAYLMLTQTQATWRAVREAQRAEIERYRERAAALERDRVARDLHDAVGSTLALTASYAGLVRRNADDPEATRRVAATLEEMGREGVVELRGLLDALSPEERTVAGLAQTAQRLADRCEGAWGMEVEVEVRGDRARSVRAMVHLAAARVLQESLHNAARHGRARRVAVTVDAGDALTLTVLDDGEGLGPAREGGRGLASMRRRAEELGGNFSLAPRPEGGMALRWTVPWEPAS